MAPQGNLVIASLIVVMSVVSGKPFASSDQDNYGKDLKSNYLNQWTGWGEQRPVDNGWGVKPVDYGWGDKRPVDNGWGVRPVDYGWGEKRPVENWNGWGEKKTDENWNAKGEQNTVENWNGWGEKKPVDNGWGEKKPVENWNGWGEKKTDQNWNGWGEKNTVENWNGWGEKKPVDNGWGDKQRVDYGWGEKTPVGYGWGEKTPIDNWNGWGEKNPIVDFGNLWSGWGDKPDSKFDLIDDEKERHVAVFIQIMKSLINREEEDTRSFLELFKQFTRVTWKKESTKGYSREELSKTQVATYEKISYNDEREWLDLCDGDEPDNEFRYKKLFLLYVKFRSHYQAQKQFVGAKEYQTESLKASKQYILYSQLVTFAKQVQHEKTVVISFSQVVETKYKTHYSYFKQCAFYSQCNRWTDFDFDGKSGFDFGAQFGNAIGDNYDRDARHFELFLKLQKFIKLVSEKTYDDDDTFRTFHSLGWDDERDDYDWRGEHPVYGYLSGLRKHLDEHKPNDFKKFFDDKEEADNKNLFFSLKGYKLLQEQKELLEKRTQIEQVFVKFSKFLQYQEEVENCKQEFSKFKEWQKAKENKVRTDEFFSFLKQVSVLKGFFTSKTYYGKDGHDKIYNKGVGEFYYGYDKSVRLSYDGKDNRGFNKFVGGNDFGRKDFGGVYKGFPLQHYGPQGYDYQREDFYKNQLAQAGYSKEKLNFDGRH
ncbi:unnamed protein product [Lymnaea stagnalis]|uniref:Uncharacterized protein n=1 Tax=Lymnaea stagnalis TaxID=6523 RepID=A0AAV2I5H7_LYMST